MAKKDEKLVTEDTLLKSLEKLEESAKSLDKSEAGDEDKKEEEEVSKACSKGDDKKDMKKGDKKDEDEDEEEDEEEKEKSFASKVEENEDIKEGFEVSEFLKSLTTEFATHVDALTAKVSKKDETIMKSFAVMADSMDKLCKSIVSVNERIEALEKSTPTVKKSVTAKEGVERKFEGSEEKKDDSKIIMKSLTDLAMVGKISAEDVTMYETRKILSKSAKDALAGILKK